MALRDQPYFPLYVQDVLTDEKLIECSAESHGVYFRLLCILHKQETYGVICLKQKYKQTDNQILNFACMLVKQMPFSQEQISKCLNELVSENVLSIDGELLYQKRMRKDGEISIVRSEVGKKGGSNVNKQYGKPGYVYLMSDGYSKNKIGVSINPLNRLYRLRSNLSLPKHFDIKDSVKVDDMGKSEDFSQEYFSDIIDGEWLKSDYSELKERFVLLKAKLQANNKTKHKANTENEYENDNEIEINNKKGIEKFDFKKSVIGLGVDESVASDWLIVRKNKKASNTETAFKSIKSEIEKTGLSANDCIKKAVEKSWCGFEAKYLNDEKNGAYKQSGTTGNKETAEERRAKIIAHATANTQQCGDDFQERGNIFEVVQSLEANAISGK